MKNVVNFGNKKSIGYFMVAMGAVIEAPDKNILVLKRSSNVEKFIEEFSKK